MQRLPSNFSEPHKIYLNPDQRVNVYKFGEEINGLYRALNNLETSVSQITLTLEDIEKAKQDILRRIETLEQEVMKLTPTGQS